MPFQICLLCEESMPYAKMLYHLGSLYAKIGNNETLYHLGSLYVKTDNDDKVLLYYKDALRVMKLHGRE
jgi:hypothetical protein